MNESGFYSKLKQAVETNHSLLCLGLDPEVAKFAKDFLPTSSHEERLVKWCQSLIQQTADLICCVKPNIAFFEQYGPEGITALKQVIDSIPAHIPVLLDVKRGDIGSTASAYARAAFEVLNADAVTLSPYLGQRLRSNPSWHMKAKWLFVLCQTSNPSAGEIQNHGSQPLYQHVARVAQTWGSPEQVAFVVGATRPESLAEIRSPGPPELDPGAGMWAPRAATMAAALQAGLMPGWARA